MHHRTLFLTALLLLSACGASTKTGDLNKNPGPTPTPSPGLPQGSGWSQSQVQDVNYQCQNALYGSYDDSEVQVFCNCYAKRVSELITYEQFQARGSEFTKVHDVLATDNAFSVCLSSGFGNATTSSATNESLLRSLR